MDIGQILGRAWKIIWKWKELWLLGLLVNMGYGLAVVQLAVWIPALGWLPQLEGMNLPSIWSTLFARAAIGILVTGILYLAWIVVWLIGHGALIAAVQQAEEEYVVNLGRAWKSGVQHFWTLLGVAILRTVPYLVTTTFSILLFLAAVPFANLRNGVPLVSPLLACGIPIFSLVGGIAFLVTYLVSLYANRAVIVNGAGWLDAFRHGWEVLKKTVGNTLLLGLIFVVTWYAANMVIGVPIWASFMSVFSEWASKFTPSATVPLIPNLSPLLWGGIAMALLGLAIGAVLQTWISVAWTLMYRGAAEAKGQPSSV